MRYLGGKHLAAPKIAEVMLANKGGCMTYLEPMLGGASVMARMAPHFTTVYGSDINLDVMLVWIAAQAGWRPPESMSRAEWQRFRLDPNPSPMRGFAGIACSYSGIWFGGYAEPDVPRVSKPYGDNPAAAGSRSILRKVEGFKHARLSCCDYRDWTPGPGWLVYLDPPYAASKRGESIWPFDHATFWALAYQWHLQGVRVFVSSYEAPRHWSSIWSGTTPRKVEGNQGATQTEHLWVPI